MKKFLSNFPAPLALILGALCPLCLAGPLILGGGLGLILLVTTHWMGPLLLILISLSLVGFYLSFRIHKNLFPLLLTLLAGGLMYHFRYQNFNLNLIYTGGLLMILAMGYDFWLRNKAKSCLACETKKE